MTDFMKSGGFHGHEIRRISWPLISWNLPDFMAMKSGRFHEIWRISWPWNLADFMPRTYKYTAYLACNVYLYWISWMKKIQHLVVDHEICWISWILANFMKSGGFHHEIQWIWSMKSGGFYGWSWKMQTWKCKIFVTLITFFLCKPNQQFFGYG